MSHYTTTVVVREAESVEDALRQAEEALAPYDENTEIDPYFRAESEESVERAIEYRANSEGGVKPSEDDPNYIDWVREAVGAYCGLSAEDGVYREETKEFGVMSTYNPDSQWDWYQLGGRWQGFYMLKHGVSHMPEALGEPGVFGNDGNVEGKVDVARKDHIDVEGMRTLAAQEADVQYDAFEQATKGLEVPEPWQTMRDRRVAEALGVESVSITDVDIHDPRVRSALEAARDEYHSHPWWVAVNEGNLVGFLSDPHESFFVGNGGREAYIQSAKDNVLASFALLIDGEWVERGKMGWFGMVADEEDSATWQRRFNEAFDALPDTAWVALYDLHI